MPGKDTADQIFLQRSVCALEEKLREIRHAVVREKQAIDRVSILGSKDCIAESKLH